MEIEISAPVSVAFTEARQAERWAHAIRPEDGDTAAVTALKGRLREARSRIVALEVDVKSARDALAVKQRFLDEERTAHAEVTRALEILARWRGDADEKV